MNKIILVLLISYLVCSCNKKSEQPLDSRESPTPIDEPVVDDAVAEEPVAKQEAVSEKIKLKFEADSITGEFPLDSLLEFDSEEALQKAFGKNVKRSIGYMPEGMGTYPNTLLFSGTEKEVEFIWNDTINFSQIQSIQVYKQDSPWKTMEGIKMGTTLKELEKINDKWFVFSGFGWDYAGGVNWNDGEMAKRNVFVNLALEGDSMSGEFDALMGDHDFSSDEPLAQKANPVVSIIQLRKE
jgi:hypothetical protein